MNLFQIKHSGNNSSLRLSIRLIWATIVCSHSTFTFVVNCPNDAKTTSTISFGSAKSKRMNNSLAFHILKWADTFSFDLMSKFMVFLYVLSKPQNWFFSTSFSSSLVSSSNELRAFRFFFTGTFGFDGSPELTEQRPLFRFVCDVFSLERPRPEPSLCSNIYKKETSNKFWVIKSYGCMFINTYRRIWYRYCSTLSTFGWLKILMKKWKKNIFMTIYIVLCLLKYSIDLAQTNSNRDLFIQQISFSNWFTKYEKF